jgi:hypothetical protein
MHRSDHFPNHASPFLSHPAFTVSDSVSHLLEGVGSSSPISEEQREAYCLEDWEIVSDCWGTQEISGAYHVRAHQQRRYQEGVSQ